MRELSPGMKEEILDLLDDGLTLNDVIMLVAEVAGQYPVEVPCAGAVGGKLRVLTVFGNIDPLRVAAGLAQLGAEPQPLLLETDGDLNPHDEVTDEP